MPDESLRNVDVMSTLSACEYVVSCGEFLSTSYQRVPYPFPEENAGNCVEPERQGTYWRRRALLRQPSVGLSAVVDQDNKRTGGFLTGGCTKDDEQTKCLGRWAKEVECRCWEEEAS